MRQIVARGTRSLLQITKILSLKHKLMYVRFYLTKPSEKIHATATVKFLSVINTLDTC